MATRHWTTPPGWLRAANKVMIGVQKAGLRPGPPHVLTLRGRRSGRPRTTPVTPFVVEGQRDVIGGFAHGDWVSNARANPEGVLRHGRRTEQVRLVELPESERGAIMREFPVQVPAGVFFFRKVGVVDDATPEAFEQGASKAAVFRIEAR